MKKYDKIKIFVMLASEDDKMLEFNQHQKSDKSPFIIYVDPECLTKNIIYSKSR